MAKAAANLPWLPSREAVDRVARHLGCTPDDAELRVIGEGKAGRINARGVIEDRPVSPLPAAWRGTIDLAGTTMKPPETSYEITNLELCFIDLVAMGLLPAPAERARWSAAEAIAYLVKAVPFLWDAWQGAGASEAEISQAEIDLGAAIGAGVPAWGRPRPFAKKKWIPADHFHVEMIEMKTVPASVARRPNVVVRLDGSVGISPSYRLAEYMGPPWRTIEINSARLRQAFPKPLQVERRMLDEAEQLYAEGGSEPAARAEESMPEPVPPAEPEPGPPTEPPRVEPVSPPAPKKGSRRKTVYRSAQGERADAVLKRIFKDGNYPAETEVVWVDLWMQFCEEYERYAKDSPSRLSMPSHRTVRRTLGWE